VLLRADEVEGSGGSICSFSSIAIERKWEMNSGSVACKGSQSSVTCIWHEELSDGVEVPRTVVNPPWRHRGPMLDWVLDRGLLQHEHYSTSAEGAVSNIPLLGCQQLLTL